PGRKDADINENLRDMELWRSLNHLFVGFEGGPGHQKHDSTGAYLGEIKTEDRWDPVVSRVGGVWDKLLDQGEDIWGALAVSDFHETEGDYAPCQYSRTYISVPEKSYQGIIQGLRAGSFWAEHGQILSNLVFMATNSDLAFMAVPGESVYLKAEHTIQLKVELQRGPAAINEPLTIEIIGNSRSGKPELLFSEVLPENVNALSVEPGVLRPGADNKSSYFRVRVRKHIEDGPDLLAYSNPIRVFK
ncbi:MAG: hypothetical protein WBN51_01130, partial [Gammaproteobacteria bacterium]